ncbi:MAG: prephenate dehydratase [Acetivibrionales bacterium]|jgi:prephenate dehydratase
MVRIGYLGPRGTFSHEALKKYMGNAPHQAMDFQSISEIFEAFGKGLLDEAIVPVENSIEGAVSATMDILAHEAGLMVKAELILPIRENLLIKPGTGISDIRYVLSHPQPLGQCRKFLSERLPHALTKAVYSTAAAAEEVMNGSGDLAAIGSAAAAEVYGLEIAVADIHDNDNNQTRFFIIGGTDAARTGNDKTSIVFSTEDKPGSLYRILEIFNLWDINMTRIESRPAKNMLGRYIFFVDIAGHREDENVKDALTMVGKKTSFLRILGSYPASRAQD